MLIRYLERQMTGQFKCIDYPVEIELFNTFEQGGLLYGYRNQYDLRSIDKDMIISPKLKNDKDDFVKAYMEMYHAKRFDAEYVYKGSCQSFIDLVIGWLKKEESNA